MARLSDFFTMQFKNGHEIKKVCFNCKYIYRPNQDLPFQSELNEPVYCEKLKRRIEYIKNNACRDFEYF